MANDPTDYRMSHLAEGKGRSYHRQFSEQPYRTLVWEHERLILDRALDSLDTHLRPRHLDFACGTGRILKHLEKRTGEKVGVDLAPPMLEVARELVPEAEIIEADLTRKDVLGDRLFELVTAFRFFPNAQESLREQAMAAMVRHLAPDGILVFNNHKNTTSLRNRLARAAGRRGFKGMSPGDADGLLKAGGLVTVEVGHFGVLPATENRLLIPRPVLRKFELFLSRLNCLTYLSQNLIYICQRKRAGRGNG